VLEGLETRQLLSVSEFSVAAAEQQAFSLSNDKAANTEPLAITSGPNGNLWFVDVQRSVIGEINPTTHQITFPPHQPPANSNPSGIAVGSDGNIWFTETGSGQIGMINVTTGALTQFGTANGMLSGAGPYGIAAGPDGNLWFTDANLGKIGMISPTSGRITEFSSPNLASGSQPYSITAGPDGNLWFTERSGHAIGKINPGTHAITTYSRGLPAGASPSGITVGSDGNLWFGVNAAAQTTIGMITTAGAITTHAITIPGQSHTFSINGITAGADGNLWFTAVYQDNLLPPNVTAEIGSINPTTLAVTAAAPQGLSPAGITAGPDGNVWFTDFNLPFKTTTNQTLDGGAVGVVPVSSTPTPTPTGTPTSPPTIIAEQISSVFRKHNKRGKGIGKPVVQITLRFSAAMNAGTVDNTGNYRVAWASTKRVKRRLQTVEHPVALASATMDPSDTVVTLVTTTPAQKFAKGGQVSIVSPGSIRGAGGGTLGGVTVFTISPRAGGISPA
jgi:streptogramin lyase